ncbi:MAG: hypothetical protein KF723_13175 [Rhizobiaceae bacterium]|nr:hypothetical protein [Rhizobiaceae bacterium]
MNRLWPACLLVAFAVAPALADQLTYVNDRFGTSVTFPAELFDQRLEPPANGDGMSWSSSDGATLSVWGTNNVLDFTPQSLAEHETARDTPGFEVTYHRVGSNWLVLSGYDEGLIFYERFVFGSDNVIHGVWIKYPESLRSTFDPIVGDIAASLKGP